MNNNFWLALSILFILNSIISTVVIILERRRPEKTISWLLLFVLLPPLGYILYIFLGRNWKRTKLNKSFSNHAKIFISDAVNRLENPEYVPLMELLAINSDSPLFTDNEITIFNNGNEKFKYLKEELMKARHHIHLEYYIVKSDEIGNEIKDIIIRKSLEGVKVRFIMDRVGSIKVKRKFITELKNAGVDVVQYSYILAPLLRIINTQINYRNHRKIVVIDGNVGFLGGINIGDEYLGKGKMGYWRDTHIMVKGDFVLGLQAVFLDDYWTIKKSIDKTFFLDENFNRYRPCTKKCEHRIMQLVKSGPNSQFASIMQSILKMITMAKHHIYIASPYFIPSESIMEALKIASFTGVDIKILFPEKSDHILVHSASKTYLQELMRYGAKVYFYNKKAFMHSKFTTIDGMISNIGTANMDIRSYELNYEVNAVIYDKDTTQKLESYFLKDLQSSTLMTQEYFENTPKLVRFFEASARLFSSLL